MLARAGLAKVSRDGSTVTLGSMTPLQELVDLAAPVGPCAANIADLEIRLQATVGGNLCAGTGEAPRGDLQGALLAVDAQVRFAGGGATTTEPLADFLADRGGKLVLDVSYEEPAAGAFVALDRPHTHEYTALAVSAARLGDGTIRLAATGAGRRASGCSLPKPPPRTPRLRVPPRSRTSTSTTTRSRPPGTGSRPSRCSSGGRSPNSEESR